MDKATVSNSAVGNSNRGVSNNGAGDGNRGSMSNNRAGMGNNRGGNSGSVSGGARVGDLSDVAAVSVGVVVDSLDAAVGEGDAVGTGGDVAIPLLLLVELGTAVVVSYAIVVGVDGRGVRVDGSSGVHNGSVVDKGGGVDDGSGVNHGSNSGVSKMAKLGHAGGHNTGQDDANSLNIFKH